MSDYTPKTVKTRHVQRFNAPSDQVFPLLCPVREYEWIDPWRCEMLHSDSGVAEKNCVFRTLHNGEIWVISHYRPNTNIEFVRVNTHVVMTLAISLVDNADGTVQAVSDLVLVGLTEQGNQAVDGLASAFAFEMRMGEAMLNHYLATGRRLPLDKAVEIASRN
jgi:hypothetical protein